MNKRNHSLGKKLRVARNEKGWSVAETAIEYKKKFKPDSICHSTVSLIERGGLMPKADMLINLSDLFDYDFIEFLRGNK